MLPFLYAIVSAVVAEMTFVAAFTLCYMLFCAVHLGLAFVFRRQLPDLLHALLSGIACGLVATFGAFALALLIVRHAGIAEFWALFLGLGLPAIGEFQCFEERFRSRFTGEHLTVNFPGRFHSAMRAFPQRYVFSYAQRRFSKSQKRNIESFEVGQMAFDHAQWYLWRMFPGSIVGALIGLSLAVRWLHPHFLQ